MKKLVLYIALFCSLGLAAQPSFTAVADTQQIKLGEPVVLSLHALVPQDSAFSWPELPDGNGIDIISRGSIDTLKEGKYLSIRQEIRLTSFDSGDVAIPALSLSVEGFATIENPAIPLLVYYPDIKEGQELNDIKGPKEIPFDYWILTYWILGALALAGLLYFLWKTAQNRPQKEPKKAAVYKIPPGEWALAELDKLEAAGLWQAGKTKAYYSELVDILRLYLERKFALKAMESTAEELILKIRPLIDSKDLFEKLKSSLQISALVKYAKHHSLPEENVQALAAVRQFVISKEAPKTEERDV